jgi:8-oxo-dGTP pyrophosphatase MutT (NUDIX family)
MLPFCPMNPDLQPEKRTVNFRGRIITLTTDEVILPNGHRAELEVVHHPGGAAAVAIDAQRVCLLRQYRYVAGGWLWELPAGKLEPNEPPLTTAQRELIEEAGVSAAHWESLGSYLSSPGIFTEVLHLFLATEVQPAQVAHEQAEVIEAHWIPFDQALEWAIDGTIRDGKTAIGLIRAANLPAVRGALSRADTRPRDFARDR